MKATRVPTLLIVSTHTHSHNFTFSKLPTYLAVLESKLWKVLPPETTNTGSTRYYLVLPTFATRNRMHRQEST